MPSKEVDSREKSKDFSKTNDVHPDKISELIGGDDDDDNDNDNYEDHCEIVGLIANTATVLDGSHCFMKM